jgi:hypothetical protein
MFLADITRSRDVDENLLAINTHDVPNASVPKSLDQATVKFAFESRLDA